MTRPDRFVPAAGRAAAALLLLTMVACDRGGSGAGTETPPKTATELAVVTLTVGEPDASGRRYASVKIAPKATFSEAQLAFEVPATCQVVAGAAVRQVKNLATDATVTQELAFQCDAGTTGSVKAKFTAVDPSTNTPFEKAMEAPL